MTQEMLDQIKRELTATTIAQMMRPPRVPSRCPVNALKVNGPGDKLAFIVSDHLGRIVEIIESHSASDDGEERFYRRWPWFSTFWASHFGVGSGSQMVWPHIVNVDNKEYKRLVGLEPWSADAIALRTPALRRERWAALSSAVSSIYGSQFKAYGKIDRSEPVVIYHRKNGGPVQSWLRIKMRHLVKLGAVNRQGSPNAIMPDGKTKVGDVVGSYFPTDLTPNPHNLNR